MRQQISPAIAGVIVVVVLGLIGLLGYKVFAAKASAGKPPPEAQKWLDPKETMKNHMRPGGPPGGGPPGGGPPPGYGSPAGGPPPGYGNPAGGSR
jgi:hypothetical protein